MRILVHDYAGHPYAVQLSRALAALHHNVLHVFCASNPMPQGSLARQKDDPKSFDVRPISLARTIQKAKFIKRRAQEVEHAKLAADVVRSFGPDIVISGSAPLDVQNGLWRAAEDVGSRTVFWLQDLTGVATEAVLRKKLPVVGAPIGKYYTQMEERLLRRSSAIVAIADDFLPALQSAGADQDKIFVIENWGPLNEVPLMPRANDWSKEFALGETFNFIYAGTLGMKHDPSLLVRLAQEFAQDPLVRIVVISEGIGRRWLEDQKASLNLENLVLLDFQPFARMPEVFAAADVLVAVLEPAAGVFSVPSKVLAYLCANRPVLGAIPKENLAARIVELNDAGLIAEPSNAEAFVAHAKRLYEDADLRERCSANGRRYAEATFDIERIAQRFEDVFRFCMSTSTGRHT